MSKPRFSALLTNSVENTDQQDFIPSVQIKSNPTKRKFSNSFIPRKSNENKRTKNSKLFHELVQNSERTTNQIQTNKTTPWIELPAEILQQIFSFVPIKTLLTQISLVCQHWNSTINNVQFRRWSKIQLKYEYEEKRTVSFIHRLIGSPENVLQQILNCVNSIRKKNDETIQFCFRTSTLFELDENLKKHRLYRFSTELLSKNQFEPIESNRKIFDPLCVTAAICILAEDVESIRILFRLWFRCQQIKYENVMDFFYYLLTLFTAGNRMKKVEFRYPFRLYYCLKEYEDEILIQYNSISQQILQVNNSYTIYASTLSKLKLTSEQDAIVCFNLENRQTMKINAFAGSGKTTTLIAYAAKRMDESFLYIAYNKSIQNHAEKVFPSNVKCQTIHSIAYAKIGRQFEGCLGNLRLKSIVDLVQDRPAIGEKGRNINSIYVRARFVYNAINNFISSADPQINVDHIDQSDSSDSNSQIVLTEKEKINLVGDAKFIWSIMKDIRDRRVLMTHDGYLKLYQLSKPQIQLFDCLFVDEAQDLTPAVTDIINNQRISKILVGDKHQQIYAFRGAVNAMEKIDSTVTFYLTKSFRFGFEVALISNLILQNLCNEKKFLVGNKNPNFLDGRSASIDEKNFEQKAFLFRTNFNLFNSAVQMIVERGMKNVGFVGGTEALGFEKLLDVYYLWLDPEERRKKSFQIKDPQLQSFSSLKNLEKFSQDVADAELIGKIKLVQMHGHSIIEKIKKIQQNTFPDFNQAKIVLSTAHKAKGLEFPIVVVADDFLPRSSETSIDELDLDQNRENLNILYVAVTRATKELILNADLFDLLYRICREPFFEFSFSSVDHRCASCELESKPNEENKVLCKFRPIQISTQMTTAGQYPTLPICVQHFPDSFLRIKQLFSSFD